jgi:hypothetical protein
MDLQEILPDVHSPAVVSLAQEILASAPDGETHEDAVQAAVLALAALALSAKIDTLTPLLPWTIHNTIANIQPSKAA